MTEQAPKTDLIGSENEKQTRRQLYLTRLQEIHGTSGLSLREVARDCDIDPTYVHRILKGDRQPKRDVIISLGFAYRLDRLEVDELLVLADLPPLGRTARLTFALDGQRR